MILCHAWIEFDKSESCVFSLNETDELIMPQNGITTWIMIDHMFREMSDRNTEERQAILSLGNRYVSRILSDGFYTVHPHYPKIAEVTDNVWNIQWNTSLLYILFF